MTQQSLFWTAGAGDGHAYSQDELRLVWKTLTGNPGVNRGVFAGQLDELAVSSPGNNQIRVASGRALVDGTFYESDDLTDLPVTSPTVGTTGKLVVLRKSWSARTVRLAIVSAADGTAAIPAPTQVDGGTWEIPLASFTITTGGVIGDLADLRERFWDVAAPDVFGDGSDGDVTIASLTTLSRDMYYNTLTVGSGQVLRANGFRVFVKETLTLHGTISHDGGTNGGGATNRIGAPTGILGGGGNGGSASSDGARGGGGGGVVVVAARTIVGNGTIRANGADGFRSSAGASGTASSGGGGTATPPTAIDGGVEYIETSSDRFIAMRTINMAPITGGAGGAAILTGSSISDGTSMTLSLGGNGGGVLASTRGGGGGGGGVVALLTRTGNHTLTLQANGGTGLSANNGAPGTVLERFV